MLITFLIISSTVTSMLISFVHMKSSGIQREAELRIRVGTEKKSESTCVGYES